VTDDDPPGGWTTWNEEPGGLVVLAYRPDVFDADRFPAACLPTILVSNGSTRRRPGRGRGDGWHVTLRLEPEVRVERTTHDSRDGALAAARDLARSFDAGEVDHRGAYQVLDGRRSYLDALDELTGRS
jgi:hypothetical protein